MSTKREHADAHKPSVSCEVVSTVLVRCKTVTYDDNIFSTPRSLLLGCRRIEGISREDHVQIVAGEHIAGEIVLLREREETSVQLTRSEVLRPGAEVTTCLGIDAVCDGPLRGNEIGVVIVVRTQVIEIIGEAPTDSVGSTVSSHIAACEWDDARKELEPLV